MPDTPDTELRASFSGNCGDDSLCFLSGQLQAYALVPAAGQGSRMGSSNNKPFLDLAGVPAIVRTLRALSSCSCLAGIIVMARLDEVEIMKSLLAPEFADKHIVVEAGGSTRQESVHKGLRYLHNQLKNGTTDPLIAIHDGARCLITREVICRTLRHAAAIAPCAAALPVKDTIKIADRIGRVERTLDRSCLYAVQTPQVAPLSLYLSAFDQAEQSGFVATDDLSILEAANIEVDLVPGSEQNIKLTTPADLIIAQAWLQAEANKNLPG
ncbi:MAG: 2-C-methyl-D-erythritol 4-phosphate cytidylyltransferase [Saccharofermentanales bacterium]|jgi:2-C-methyl-D-erythritol 4-phosphate cytidylyltransferase